MVILKSIANNDHISSHYYVSWMPTGPPSSPVNLTSSVQQYARINVSIILQWNPPVDSGSTSVDNYTITVTGPTIQELTSLRPTANITVVYNEMYTVNVRASNCVGSSTSATASIFQGKDHVFGIKGWVCWVCIYLLYFHLELNHELGKSIYI